MILNISFNPSAGSLSGGYQAGIKFKVMKTISYTIRLNRLIILISIFLLLMSFTVNAQSRSRNGSSSSSRTGIATVKKSNDSKNARTTLNYNGRSTNNSNEGRFIERNEKPQTQNYTYKSSGYKNHEPVHYNNLAYHNNHYEYVKPIHYKKHYHPAPWTYYNYPVVFYHNNFGEYYYHNGGFYRYNRKHGYYAIDLPLDIYFRTIPVGYRRVYINGHLFYQYNGIYFRHTSFGYQIVPRSSGIYITASF
jgi:hypothetical protein